MMRLCELAAGRSAHIRREARGKLVVCRTADPFRRAVISRPDDDVCSAGNSGEGDLASGRFGAGGEAGDVAADNLAGTSDGL